MSSGLRNGCITYLIKLTNTFHSIYSLLIFCSVVFVRSALHKTLLCSISNTGVGGSGSKRTQARWAMHCVDRFHLFVLCIFAGIFFLISLLQFIKGGNPYIFQFLYYFLYIFIL